MDMSPSVPCADALTLDASLGSPGGLVLPFPKSTTEFHGHLSDLFRENQAALVRFLTIRLGSEAEAQEAAQEAYVRLLQRSDTLTPDNLKSLLFVAARNIAIDRLRERQRRPAAAAIEEHETDTLCQDDVESPERILAGRRRLALIRQLLDELPPKCRFAFVSYKFHDKSYGEIAARMGLTESMVRKYVLRALAHCAARFEQLEAWE